MPETEPKYTVTADMLYARIGALDVEKRMVEIDLANTRAKMVEAENIARMKHDAMMKEIMSQRAELAQLTAKIADLRRALPDPFALDHLPLNIIKAAQNSGFELDENFRCVEKPGSAPTFAEIGTEQQP